MLLPVIPAAAPRGLSVPDGWKTVPFTEFICKVHSLCNLDCDYCYVYHHADQSWRRKPRQMSFEQVELLAGRIREHAQAHSLPDVRIVLHGGEPLLVGVEYLRRFASLMREQVGAVTRVHLGVQTNATLLTTEMLDALSELDVRVGVSLDGDAKANDRHRLFHNGQSSFRQAQQGLELLLTRYRPLFGGLLAVMDPSTQPLEVYRHLLGYSPPILNFLFPDGNWEARPTGKDEPLATPYADWLIPIFDHWFHAARRPTDVRLFSEILHLLFGGRNSLESLGLARVSLLVVETDGTYEGTDTLKAAFEGAPATGMNLAQHRLDEVAHHPSVVVRQLAEDALGDECKRCELRSICGGGFYPHRYRAGSFQNPSVYCSDMIKLIRHVQTAVGAEVARLRAHSAASA